MTCVAVQKQREPGSAKDGNSGPGPLLCLMALLYDPGAIAGPFRTADRAHGVLYHRCKNSPVIKHGRYRKHLRRYPCKDCGRTFNDKTDTILHCRHIWMGNWMLALRAFLCGPPNGVSINHTAESIGCAYRSTYCMIRRMMDKIRNLPEGIILSGTGETEEGYIRAGSKGGAAQGQRRAAHRPQPTLPAARPRHGHLQEERPDDDCLPPAGHRRRAGPDHLRGSGQRRQDAGRKGGRKVRARTRGHHRRVHHPQEPGRGRIRPPDGKPRRRRVTSRGISTKSTPTTASAGWACSNGGW